MNDFEVFVDQVGEPLRGALLTFLEIFKNENFAPVLAAVLIVWAFLIIVKYRLSYRAMFAALGRRSRKIQSVIDGKETVDERRAAFAQKFVEIDEVMKGPAPRSTSLTIAWEEYKESIVDETTTPIRNTARPSTFFLGAVPQPTKLAYWSNFFVGFGLLLTFLGIVAALTFTSEGLNTGGDVESTQQALRNLLTVAAVKFLTSIGGLVGSLSIRWQERKIAAKLARQVRQLCELLEQGLLYVSIQSLAANQLRELESQTAQLEKFNTDLALSIGEKVGAEFRGAIAPLTESLNSVGTRLVESQTESLGVLKDGIGSTVDSFVEASGGLMENIEVFSNRIERSTESIDASEQSLRRLVSSLNESLDSYNKASVELQEAASGLHAAAEPVHRIAATLSSTSDRLAEVAEKNEQTTTRAMEELGLLVNQITEMETTLNETWSSYKDRFEKVDEDLQKALTSITDAFETNVGSLTDFTRDFDRAMASTVGQLAEVVEPITEFAEELGELSHKLGNGEAERAP